jgi:uncharacterized membrane protein YidH (DUF202 family)
MELEVLGARVLAPYFGSSVYVVMGSVIGVFLLSLSVGYMLGGWLSQGPRSGLGLAISLVAAGLWLCAIPFLTRPVCDGILNLGLDEKWGSLLACLILFSIPTALLGTVSPMAVRWLTRQASRSGLEAGIVLALSTVAGFAGCVVSAFYLVLLSVRRTLWTSGALTVALGGVILLHILLTGERHKPTKDSADGPL